MTETALIFSDVGREHVTPVGHPEWTGRLAAIQSAFEAAALDPPRIEPNEATREDLLRVHTADHVDTIRATCANSERYNDPDTFMVPGSWPAALLAAGAAIDACKAVLDGAYTNVFSAMRPPGHHAERDRAMGFCLFNNVAVAARWLRDVAGAKRVAIFDWDIHHGNGTQHIFYDDPTVFYASIHESPLYPRTGFPSERGAENSNLNVLMKADAPADEWFEKVESKIIPELDRFDPEFFLLSCGFDAHIRDPLGHQSLQTEDYVTATHMVKDLAGGRLVSLLEGGYNLEALGESSVAHFQALGENASP